MAYRVSHDEDEIVEGFGRLGRGVSMGFCSERVGNLDTAG